MEKTEVFHIKTTLTDYYLRVRGNPYRILVIDPNDSLYDLAAAILASFDFGMDHCFGFYDNFKRIGQSQEAYEYFTDLGEESCRFPGVEETKIKEVFNSIKKKMLFFFDYGDSWKFISQLVGVETNASYESLPQVIKVNGNALPQYEYYEE